MPPAPTPAPPLAIPNLRGSDAADKAEADAILAALEGVRGAPIIVYWTSPLARVSESTCIPLFDQLQALGHRPEIDLVLFTFGGDTEAPWPIISLIREYCDGLAVLVPHRAQSAGTLIALGADEIVMTPLSVLGPIDPTRTHHLLPTRAGAAESEPISVQDMRHAMTFVRSAFGRETKFNSEAMAAIFSALFEKVHPLAIGAIEQSYALAKLIAKQCLGTHMDQARDKRRIAAIADLLCDEFKSHAYEIGRKEARSIGLNAVNAAPQVESILLDLWRFYVARPNVTTPLAVGQQALGAIAWLDSLRLHQRVEGQYVGEATQVKYLSDRWTNY